MKHDLWCIECEERIIENPDTRLCATCARNKRKADQTQVKEKKPINKVSAKRAVENKEYARLRRDYLEAYPVCEVVECHLPSKEIHHMQGREGDKLTDINFFLAVCPGCHMKIEKDTQWARDNGYSILRSI